VLLIPRSTHLADRVGFDWAGLARFFPAVVALFVAVSFANTAGWTSPVILGLFAAAVAAGVAFVRLEARTPEPMVDLALCRRPRFVLGLTSGLLAYLVLFGVLFLVPFYLERGLALGVGRAGLELMVMPVALGVVAPLAGRLADRVGARPLTVGGLCLVSAGLVALGALRPPTEVLVALLAAVGVGLGLFIPPNNAAIMGSVPARQSGLASGILNMTRGLGTALGLALTGLVFDLSGGHRALSGALPHAFSVSTLFLAAVALLGAALAAARGAGPLTDGRVAVSG
jgi:MFS family permease